MNQSVLKRLQPAYQALYASSKKGRLPNELVNALQNQINFHRQRIYRGRGGMGPDRLTEKLREQGNNGGWMWQRIQNQYPEFFQDKGVANEFLGEWVSVEIECILPNPGVEVALVTFLKKNNLGRYITMKHDGSLRTFTDCICPPPRNPEVERRVCTCPAREALTREIVVSFRYGHWDFLTLICGKLNSMGVKVNVSCGLHVHFDCRHIDSRKVSLIGRRVARCIPALKTLLPKSRLNNPYCQTDINRHRQTRRENREARYAFVNLMAYGRHKTLEIRGHSGTTDAKKIINWIRMLRKIMDTRNTKIITDPLVMAEKFKFEDDLTAYVKERFEKFSKAPARHPLAPDDVTEDNLGASKEFPSNFDDMRSGLGIRERSQEAVSSTYTYRVGRPTRLQNIVWDSIPASPAPVLATPEPVRAEDAAVNDIVNAARRYLNVGPASWREPVIYESDTHAPTPEPAPSPAGAVTEVASRTIAVDLESSSGEMTQEVIRRIQDRLGMSEVTEASSTPEYHDDFDYEPDWDT